MYKEKILELTKAKMSGSLGGYVGCCPVHGDKNPSLSITFKEGLVNPLLNCHKSCTQDELIFFFKRKNLWVNLDYQKTKERIQKANKLWLSAKPLTKECLGTKYLEKRGLQTLIEFPNTIRFAENVPYRHDDGQILNLPCLIFKIEDNSGTLIGVQRIYLNCKAEKYKSNNPRDSAKKILGLSKSGYIKFSSIQNNGRIHIAEGPETSLAIFLSTNESTYCMINANNLSYAPTPKTDETLHMWADKDESGTGENEARKALALLASNGHKCKLHLPKRELPPTKKSVDFLDVYNDEDKEITITEYLAEGEEIIDFPMRFSEPVAVLPLLSPDYLPPKIWAWVEANTKRLQVHPEEVAIPFLAVIGAAMGPRIRIKLKQHDNWIVVPNLWGMSIAPPGSKKTPAINLSVSMLSKIDSDEQLRVKEIRAKNETLIKLKQAQINQLTASYSKGKDSLKEHELLSRIESLTKEIENLKPKIYRTVAQSATIEKLISELSGATDSMLVFRDELSGLFSTFLKNGHESDRQFFLEAWNGDSRYLHETISRNENLADPLCLSIFGGTQPSIVNQLVIKAKKGQMDDGFLQRFQLAIYPNPIRGKKFVDVSVDAELSKDIEKIVQAIYEIRQNVARKNKSKNDYLLLQLDENSYEEIAKFLAKLEEIIENEEDEIFKSHIAKYFKMFAGLIAIFHSLNQVILGYPIEEKVEIQSVKNAERWCYLLYEHAKKIYGMNFTLSHQAASVLAIKIKKRQVLSGMTASEITKKDWKDLKTIDEVEGAIQFLQEHNWLKYIDMPPGTKGGRPSKKILLHKKIEEFLAIYESKEVSDE